MNSRIISPSEKFNNSSMTSNAVDQYWRESIKKEDIGAARSRHSKSTHINPITPIKNQHQEMTFDSSMLDLSPQRTLQSNHSLHGSFQSETKQYSPYSATGKTVSSPEKIGKHEALPIGLSDMWKRENHFMTTNDVHLNSLGEENKAEVSSIDKKHFKSKKYGHWFL